MNRLGELVGKALSFPGVRAVLSPLARGQGVIFRLHRLADPERGTPGRDPELLRGVLAYLREQGCEFVPLDELVTRSMGEGPPLHRAVAFTMDDGFVDQATIGAPLFAEFDCPVTTFVTTGFLDRELWFWWDKIEYVFLKATRQSFSVKLGDSNLSYNWEDKSQRASAVQDFTERCKRVADEEKHAGIAALAVAAAVDLPDSAPFEYEPMSWDQLRACEASGMTFGPHSVTHPILAQATEEQSRYEIEESLARLSAEATKPVPILAYPNGRWPDFGQREIENLKRAGYLAAVVTENRYVSRSAAKADPDERFKLGRFGNANSLTYATRVITGAERLRLMVWKAE
jgi:peptidoglycan/xylan/chitin deacetylase (PgdA/CDA1 family)